MQAIDTNPQAVRGSGRPTLANHASGWLLGVLFLTSIQPFPQVDTAAAASTVVAWGSNANGQTNVPPNLTNVTMIAGGHYHFLVLKREGTVAGWGDNSYYQLNIPTGLTNVAAIAAG